MEIRVLRYFLEIAREENMTRAAERLHVSQPSLSRQMKELEEELGRKLFVRSSYSIHLTDEGMLLRKRAEDLLAMADKIAMNLRPWTTSPAVTFTLAAPSRILSSIWRRR